MSTRKVVGIGLWGGVGSRQRFVTRRSPSQASKIDNPVFTNMNGVPKPLMPIATVPMSRIGLDKLREAGISEVYGTTHVLHDAIEAYYLKGAGNQLGVRELWYEKLPMGTAPGLVMNLMIRADLRATTVVVVSGDIISDLDIAEAVRMHHERGSQCTIALNPVPRHEVSRFGTAHFVPTDGHFGRVDAFKEKRPPHEALQSEIGGRSVFLNNSSVYIFDPEIFLKPLKDGSTILQKIFPRIESQLLQDIISGKVNVASAEEARDRIRQFGPHNKAYNDFGSNIFDTLAREGLMHGYYFEEYWNDVGDNETYWFANWHALARRFRMNIPYPEVDRGVWHDTSAELIAGSTIIPPVVLGRNVKVDAGAIVGPYAILDAGTIVESKAQVAYVITWPAHVTAGYPDGIPYHVIRSGARIEKSWIAGRLPVGDHAHKVVIGDGETVDKSRLIRTIAGLKIPVDSEIAVAKQTKRVLIVDDDKEFLDPLVDTLRNEGWECIGVAKTLEEARKKMHSTTYDVIILDSILTPGEKEESEGVALLKEQKTDEQSLNYETPILFWSGFRSVEALKGISPRESMEMGQRNVFLKRKDDEDVQRSKISKFILEKLLKII